MPKRARAGDAAPSKQSTPKPIACIVCGLYVEGKTAIVRGLLKELKNAAVIVSDLKVGQQAVPKNGGAFELTQYVTETPQMPRGPIQNVVVLSHDLARPSRVAAAMVSDNSTIRLLTVLDARSFLDDWESAAELPSALREAAKKDVRAHLHDQKACVVLAECLESVDVIALSHTESADADELEMMEAMLRALNPSVTIVRRTGDGEGGGKLLEHVTASEGSERPTPAERGGCWQTLRAARGREEKEDVSDAEEEEEGEEDDDEEEDEEGGEGEDGEGRDECEEGEEEGEEGEEGEEEGEEGEELWFDTCQSTWG